VSTFYNTSFTLNYFINNLLLTVILKHSFVLNYYFNFFIQIFFLILYLTTILKINYIFIINLNLNFLKIKKCEHNSGCVFASFY